MQYHTSSSFYITNLYYRSHLDFLYVTKTDVQHPELQFAHHTKNLFHERIKFKTITVHEPCREFGQNYQTDKKKIQKL